ncbi:type II toxin-antitoxin system VapC family toxin [Desulfurivibrio dismutans]|uniref:type II toxin-antitoxin system VapC family toxin n=1 Tax=Desulfurivibrio dismutans TaxID=1398908 RepID=UPI0023DCDC47|nr:type II toxin-antitoxin system VapC family toxin [Desulfurivibrio alkaliphilus]MDF1614366.1 type II toxin-antitoxin system VapC family toxin [Desulfurivibrio alkaliphilus]
MNAVNRYFDTSALLPYYRTEPATAAILVLLRQLRPPVLISDLTKVELSSAIARWVRMEELDESQAALLTNAIAADLEAGLFRVRPLATRHYRQAEKWLTARTTPLRTLDALHLACCHTDRAQLVTCDRTMHQAAQTLGIASQLIQT